MIGSTILNLIHRHIATHNALPSHVLISTVDFNKYTYEIGVPSDEPRRHMYRLQLVTGYGSVWIEKSDGLDEHMVRIVEYHDFRDALKEATDD